MDNLVGVVMPTGTLIGGYLAMGGGSSVEKFIVHFTNENETITSDKTIQEIVNAYNSGKIIEGLYMFGDMLAPVVLEPTFISYEENVYSAVQLLGIFDTGDEMSSYAIVGLNDGSSDEWSVFAREIVNDDNYVHTDNNFTSEEKYKLENVPEIIDLSSYQVGDTITDTTIISKLMNDGSKIKYGDTIYTYARLDVGIVRLYTVMADVDHGEYIALIVQSNGLLFYEKQNAYWELPSNKVTSLSASSTDNQYPSAKCVYDLVGDIESLLNNINSGGGV